MPKQLQHGFQLRSYRLVIAGQEEGLQLAGWVTQDSIDIGQSKVYGSMKGHKESPTEVYSDFRQQAIALTSL